MPHDTRRLMLAALACVTLAACATGNLAISPHPEVSSLPPQAADTTRVAPTTPAGPIGPPLGRADFNRLAAALDLPLFWVDDRQSPGELNPAELIVLGVGLDRGRYVDAEHGQFTDLFRSTYAALVEQRRREAVRRELDQGMPTLVASDFRPASEQDRAIVRHVVAGARLIEELYAMQLGTLELRRCLRPDDRASAALFRRNQSPWCQAPATATDPFCNACPAFPPRRVGVYPADVQEHDDFCERLSAHSQAKALLDPFTVVRQAADGLEAVPYQTAYSGPMRAVAAELRAAAAAITSGEAAFKAYLLAAAAAFENGDWEAADVAWAAMNSGNSRWYLRIAPDEVYWDPCNCKAGFHVSFATIDPDSATWQQKLNDLRTEMESRLATAIGTPYIARDVQFQMPDFIEIVLNAGDARSPSGATIGQSLPNWGKVAESGGRTVVMSNLYTDADSRTIARARAEALLAPELLAYYTEDKRLTLLDIILHEATHNFGPTSDTRLDGKRPSEVFGGATATVLEELKAQNGALFYLPLLQEKGLLTTEDSRRVMLHAVLWAFGHISRGMFDGTGRPRPYSQLAAIQLGFLSKAGALRWNADAPAANGTDRGRFEIDFDKIAPAMAELAAQTGRIKATGDTAGAETLIDEYVTGASHTLVHEPEVAERLLRAPKASFVYSVIF